MSENVELVRQPLAVAGRSRRPLDERMALRFPGALNFLDRLMRRLPPKSRLRRALFHRAAQLGLEAANRRDYDEAHRDLNRTPQTAHPGRRTLPPPNLYATASRNEKCRRGLQKQW